MQNKLIQPGKKSTTTNGLVMINGKCHDPDRYIDIYSADDCAFYRTPRGSLVEIKSYEIIKRGEA